MSFSSNIAQEKSELTFSNRRLEEFTQERLQPITNSVKVCLLLNSAVLKCGLVGAFEQLLLAKSNGKKRLFCQFAQQEF